MTHRTTSACMPLRLFALVAVFLLAAATARAQLAVYGTFEGDQIYSNWYKGGTVGVYDDFYKFGPVHLGVDGRGSFLTGSNGNKNTRILGGLRLAVKPPVLPIKPYAEVLGGVSSTDINSLPGIRHGVAEANGGVDFTFFPHLDWRVVEIGGTLAQKGNDNNFHVSTGLVLRFF